MHLFSLLFPFKSFTAFKMKDFFNNRPTHFHLNTISNYRDIVVSVPDSHNKVSIVIKRIVIFFLLEGLAFHL